MRKDTHNNFWQELSQEMEACTDCALYDLALRSVPPLWRGDIKNINAFFIGEGPGAIEDAQGKPFVGQAGILLQQLLYDIKLTEHVYITNIVKHRPPSNRKPTEEEINTCGDKYLRQEIETVQPKIIVALGRTAAEYLLRISNIEQKGSLRGLKFVLEFDNVYIPVVCTWHPAYILRQENKKDELIEDLLYAKEYTERKAQGSCTPQVEGATYGQ